MLPETPIAWVALVATALGAASSFAIAVVARRREAETPRVRGYARYAFAGGLWAVVYCGVLLSTPGPVSFAFDVLRAVTAVSTVWLFLLFVANYTGNRDRFARPLRVAFAVDVVAYGALYATQPLHGWVFSRNEAVVADGLTVLAQEPTVLFTVHAVAVLGVTFLGMALLARFAFAARNVFREQTVAVLAGVVFTVLSGTAVAFNLAGGGAWQYFDPTPIAYAVNSVIIGWALFRLDFLTVGPLAANTLLEEMDDAVFVLDGDDRVVDANRTAKALVDGDVVGESLQAVVPGATAAMDGDDPVELAAPDDPDGGRFYDVNVTPLRDPYDVRRGSLIVFRDVTERVRRERQLERRNEQLDEFASLVSHDLRNPLGVARGYADLAVESGDPEHVREVQASLERMDELVDDLLAVARHDQDAVDAAPVPIADCANAAWGTVETEGASLVVDVDGVVEADRSRLRQAFENLFRNSVEHGSTGNRTGSGDSVEHGSTGNRTRSGDSVEHGATPSPHAGDGGAATTAAGGLTVTVGALEDGAGFFVADDGPGIPASERDAVFESGYSTTEVGTGYGLAIVRSVAEAHDWTVNVAESADGGARFEFRDVHFVE